MNERFLGSNENEKRPFAIAETQGWSDPSRREAYEDHFGTALGEYGYKMTDLGQMMAIDLIASGVVTELNKDHEDGKGFRAISHGQYDNPDGSFSDGVILFGASSRERATKYQAEFAERVNEALEALEANIRLGEHTG